MWRFFFFVIFVFMVPIRTNAQRVHVELFAANYGVSFGQQFFGKVLRGGNVFESFFETSYEALPSATLQYAGMRMVGSDWRLALPAQILVQKGVMIQRRSILGSPVFSSELLTSWELNYFWFNFRMHEGRVLFPRLNVQSAIRTLLPPTYDGRYEYQWEASLFTGTIVRVWADSARPAFYANAISVPPWGAHGSGNIWLGGPEDDKTFSHELVHNMQYVRSGAVLDVVLRQDVSQLRPIGFLRVDGFLYVAPDVPLRWPSYLQSWVVSLVSSQTNIPTHLLFHEWEANRHSGTMERFISN